MKHWITLNEPHTVAIQGYDAGLHAPGRCSVLLHLYCKTGNSGTEPYIVAHNFILAHATVSDMYRRKYKVSASFQPVQYIRVLILCLCDYANDLVFFLLNCRQLRMVNLGSHLTSSGMNQ